MITVILVIHILIAAALVGVVLLQRSEGGGLGIGGSGGGGGMSGFLTGRGTANLLTRTTAGLAAAFMATSMVLAILSGGGSTAPSLLDQVPAETQEAPTGTDAPPSAAPAPDAPPAPPGPTPSETPAPPAR
jgi:preprotein translocase subunit SecG